MRLALCQINATVGDLDGNAEKVLAFARSARDAGAALAVFPELVVSGYPPEDLLLKRHFLDRCEEVVGELASQVALPSLVGYPELSVDVFNSCAVLNGGAIQGIYRKQHLPNYGVFDEYRYFRRGQQPALITCGDAVLGLTVCEDIWLATGPANEEAAAGAQVIVNLSASPYRVGRGAERERMLATRAADTLAYVVLVNQVGGQDELVFDGHSVAVDHEGTVIARGPQFEEALVLVDIDVENIQSARLQDTRHRSLAADTSSGVPMLARLQETGKIAGPADARANVVAEPLDELSETYAALRCGLRDYVDKNGFSSVVLGISGGIDSALVAALAADSLGPDRVLGVTMPSRFSATETHSDAQLLCSMLGIELWEMPIEPVFDSFLQTLAPYFQERPFDVAEENLQSRIRGTLLMAVSNKFGHLLLTTGNKSEVSVGYMTLYGDMAGGFAPIKDVPKALVFELARWLNDRSLAAGAAEVIPQSIIERPPSAELRADQRDTDSLPPYEVLDRILELYVEHDRGRDELVEEGFSDELVDRVTRLVDLSEHKRRQAPPGIRIGSKAFGRDRRLPITNRFRG